MNKKKITIIAIVSIILIIILSILIGAKFSNKKITNIIDNDTLNRVTQVKCSNEITIDTNQMMSDLKQSTFKKYKGDLGSTAHITYVFMDENNNILFKYTEIGNRNIVSFSINNKTIYYIKDGVLN